MKKLLLSAALVACISAIAFPAAASTVAAPSLATATSAAASVVASMSPTLGAASSVAAACDTPRALRAGDQVVFHAGAHDPTFAEGSRLDAEVTHVWSEQCINVEIVDAAGERHSRTSVRFLPPGLHEPIGHYATLKQAQVATG